VEPEAETEGILHGIASGDRCALNRLYELLYPRLHKAAEGKLRRWHSISPRSLVNEAFFRMNNQWKPCRNLNQFIALYSLMMTRVLLDRMKKRRPKHESLHDSVPVRRPLIVEDLLSVRECLNKLRQIDRRTAKVVKLRFYGGLSNIETAEVMGVSVATVEADSRFASAWLYVQLKKGRQNGNSPRADGTSASAV